MRGRQLYACCRRQFQSAHVGDCDNDSDLSFTE